MMVYRNNDGLQNNKFNINAYHKTKDGYMLFGGNNGLNIFKPDIDKKISHEARIIFTDFQLHNKSVFV